MDNIYIYILVGGFNHLERYEFVNGKHYPIYEMDNKIHVWNHQPVSEFVDEHCLHQKNKLIPPLKMRIHNLW